MLSIVLEFMVLMLWDALFIGLYVLALVPLAIRKRAAYAVLKRNFLAYFANPTGYVFLCLFVLLTSLAAFWPHEFFQSNLANLDELNRYLPLIMLVFIPAITMSIWAEEKRQGTDELLLTIPAGDFDIVLGKYLAAVSIFSSSLLFSQLVNYAVLNALTLGDLDTGLFFTTYIGYWMIGLAMLAVGMVASFLTSNLTVGFILGGLFNLPLVAAMWADTVVRSSDLSASISRWSYFVQFEDFGRGVIAAKSVTYFLMIVMVCIYMSIVLIGRRHWLGGRDGTSFLGHYLARTLALVIIAMGVNLLFANNDYIRFDFTDEKVSSVSPDTRARIKSLDLKRPVYIEAFVSKALPEMYVKTKYDMISMLNELKALGGGKIVVNLYDNLDPFSDEAARAKDQYDINAEPVLTRSRGAFRQEDIILGAAFRCGLEKVVVPFFDHGIPVEYEMVRSICTVAEEERLKIGVIRTDAQLFGGFQMTGMMPQQIPKQLIIKELEKQYDVVEVDPGNPIEETYHALLAVQPSSLTQPQMTNLIDAIRRGIPTAIFEDPMPVMLSSVPGTSEPKRPQGGGMFGGGRRPPEPKGNIQELWDLIGVEMLGESSLSGEGRSVHVVWQDYNPYPKTRHFAHFTRQFVFVGSDAPGAEDALNSDEPITSGLKQLLFLYPGAISKQSGKKDINFEPLARTGTHAGFVKHQDLMMTRDDPTKQRWVEGPIRRKAYTLAARIWNKALDEEDKQEDDSEESSSGGGEENSDDRDDADADQNEEGKVNVVYVADIDLLGSVFLRLRARPEEDVQFEFDNVTFVLNVLDFLAGDDRFLEIRKRQTRHSTLKTIEMLTENAREEADQAVSNFEKYFKEAEEEAKAQMEKNINQLQNEVDEIRQRRQAGEASQNEEKAALIRLAMRQQIEERRRDTQVERLKRERDRQLDEITRSLDQETLKVQNTFKLWAAILPPIPPLLVGFVVFVYRRLREREGVSKDRMKY